MCRCRTRRSTSPMETSPSTSGPRSSPATTSRPRSPRPSAATSTSRRAGEKGSTRSSFRCARAELGRKVRFSGVLLGEWVSSYRGRYETFRVYRSRTGKFVLHVERSRPSTRWSTARASRPAGADTWARQRQLRQQAAPNRPSRSSTTLEELREKIPPQLYDMVAASAELASRRGPRHLTRGLASPSGEVRMTAIGVRSAIRATGLRKSYGTQVVLDGIDLEVAEGTCLALLGPNGAGKTTMVQHPLDPDRRRRRRPCRSAGHDAAREPDAVRAVIGVTGQFSAVDGLFTGEENLRLMADLRHLGKAEGRRRVDELLERFDLVDAAEEACRDLLRRHAPASRPRDDPDRRSADHLPRRADGRARSAQPARHVADDPGPRRRGRDDLPHDAVPRGGGSAGPSDRRPRSRAC